MSDPGKAFEVAAGVHPASVSSLIGGAVIVALLLAGAWAWISHYKGFANQTMSGEDLGKRIIRFTLFLVIMLLLIRYVIH